MRSLVSVTRTTKRGLTSTWHFVQAPDGFYAFGGCHKPLVKRFDTVEELRALYEFMAEKGYRQLSSATQLELAFA